MTETKTETKTETTVFNVDYELQKLLNSLEPNETDVTKIAEVTHKSLLIMSVRDAATVINSRKEKNNDVSGDGEEMKLFDEIVQKSYLFRLELLKEKLLD